MRSFPINSPEAAARIIALVVLGDGHASPSEFESITRQIASEKLGITPDAMLNIMQTTCEDLLMERFIGGSILSHLDKSSLRSILFEVNDPELQEQVFELASHVALSDQHLSEGEADLLEFLREEWKLPPALG